MPAPFAPYRLVVTVTLLLLGGILLNAALYYHQTSDDISRSLVEQDLPLSGDSVMSEIDQGILRPLSVAELMARDTFLLDWLRQGEIDPARASRYLSTIDGRYGISGSFLVSERTHRYYYARGVLKTVSANDPSDSWYFRSSRMREPHEINIDWDMTNGGKATIFINQRVVDAQGKLLGVIGVGLELDRLRARLAEYERRLQRRIYFIDRDGRIMLDSAPRPQRRLQDLPGLAGLADAILAGGEQPQRLEYRLNDKRYLLSSRLLPELGWRLLVEQDETGPLQKLHRRLLANLAINSAILLLVVLTVLATLHRHQDRLRQLATTDQLTGCLNRLAFLELLPGWLRHCQRIGARPLLQILDIDHFKQVNDQHGHQVGDQLLREITELLRSQLRGNDLLIRWGGEEFVVLSASYGDDDALAERLRLAVSRHVMHAAAGPVHITVSIGLCQWLEPETLESAVSRADKALYAAKQGGRNRVCRAEPASVSGIEGSAKT
ncbi:sensor domain-containing diguanylate cyclase [Chromobacterium sp. CV08]|uniref:sensor domain-containing diguanylate cyclase n=1 Tax=Chromobacterium sp. CV08 TaxID=3133274 RepID=UPI003DA87BB8